MIKGLNISSFNIRCFGADGVYDGKLGVEGRLDFLKHFIKTNLLNTDVLILQEILKEDFLKEILPSNFKFKTYEHSYERHMKVVICYKDDFQLINETIIDNTAIDYKNSRPAFYGLLINKKDRTPVLHTIGVHLKSGIHHTENRLKQVSTIKDFISKLDLSIPVAVGGDFNSHAKAATKKEFNDMDYMTEILSKVSLARVKNSDFTYYTQWEKETLDHFWVTSQNLDEASFLWTYNIEEHSKGFDSLYSIKTYYAEISDHLPISTKINLK